MPTIKTTYTYAWDAGAISIAMLDGSGGYTFQVGQSVGIVCGLNNNNRNNHYSDINHGFFIQDKQYRIIERSSFKTSYASFPADAVFKVAREGTTVSYFINDDLIYTSLTPSSWTVFLDCSLFAHNDEILSAAIFYDDVVEDGTGEIELASLQVFGTDEDAVTCFIELQPLTVTAEESETSAISIELAPLMVIGSDIDAALINLSLSPLTVYGEDESIIDTAVGHIELAALSVYGYETFGQPEIILELAPLQVFGIDEDIIMGHVELPALEVHGYASVDAYFMMSAPQFTMSVTWGYIAPEPAPAVDWDASAIYYRCILTGGADGLPDVELPISSFQARMRANRPSYLGVVVPNAPMHIDHIAARPNGEIVIYQGLRYSDGINYDELIRVNYESMGYNRGARNSSIDLSGYKTISSMQKIVDLRGVSIIAMQKTGVRRVTAAVDFRLRAGDTVEWGSDSMISGMVAIAVGRNHATMTITEVEA